MTAITVIAVVGLLLCIFVQLRNCIVYNVRTKHSKQVHQKNLQLIDEGRYSTDRIEYDTGDTYDQQMWQLSKWTYEDFYGEKK